MGSIYKPRWKDKDGNVRESALWWIKYYRGGRPYRESTKSTRESVARRFLKIREGEIAEGKLPGIVFDRVKFTDLVDDYLTHRRVNARGPLGIGEINRIEKWRRTFEGLRAVQITTPRVNAYVNARLDAGAAHATVNREVRILSAILHLAARQTPPKVNRVPYLPSLEENNVRKGFFEADEFDRVRDNLPDHLKGLATIGYLMGWRLGEIVTLTWAQVDMKQGTVRLEAGTTKNKDARLVYMDAESKEVFETQLERRRAVKNLSPWVFLNRKGSDRVKRFNLAWKTACREAGCPGRLFHDLRRTAVRDLDRAGVSRRVGMNVTGHRTESVYSRYNIVDDRDMRQAAEMRHAYRMGQKPGKVSKVTMLNPHRASL
jgi:integrase